MYSFLPYAVRHSSLPPAPSFTSVQGPKAAIKATTASRISGGCSPSLKYGSQGPAPCGDRGSPCNGSLCCPPCLTHVPSAVADGSRGSSFTAKLNMRHTSILELPRCVGPLRSLGDLRPRGDFSAPEGEFLKGSRGCPLPFSLSLTQRFSAPERGPPRPFFPGHTGGSQ